jgi:hypothetical protein
VFDRRVLTEPIVRLIQACQRRAPCHLGGGAALSGAYLHHRLTGDVDLFVHGREEHIELKRSLPSLAEETGLHIRVVRDAGGFVRCQVGDDVELDLVQDLVPDLESPGAPIEGILVESLTDLRANKLTCILSRSEPRDLVDLLFLERAGYPPELDLPLALRKDAGMDPAVLAWLLKEFPCRPLPRMLVSLTEEELVRYRDELAGRFRRLARPDA